MAEINLRHLDRNATREETVDYINYLVTELEYILQNLDEDNMNMPKEGEE